MSNDTRRLKVVVDSDVKDADRGLDKLNRQLDKTGVTATKTGVVISKAFDAAPVERNIKQFEKLQSKLQQMGQAIDSKKAGTFTQLIKDAPNVGKKLSAGLADGMASNSKLAMNPVGIAIGAALAVGVAPIIGAAASTAIVGGAAGLGIVGGIKLASKDPAVKSAADSLKDYVGSRLEQAASPFVPALVKQMGKARGIFDSVQGELKRIFSASARYLDPLTTGLGGFVRNIVPGITKAVERAKPLFDGIATVLPKVGDALGDAFDEISKHSGEIKAFVLFLGDGIARTIRFGTDLVSTLTSVFGWLVKGADAANNLGANLLGWLPGVGKQFKDNSKRTHEWVNALNESDTAATGAGGSVSWFAGKVQATGARAENAKAKLGEWQTQISEAANAAAAAANAEIGYQSAIDDATAAVKENGRTLDINSVKGRANKSQLLALAGQVNALSASVLTETGSQAAATKAAEAGRKKFIELAQKMGASKSEAIKLAEKLVPLDKKYVTNVTTKGVSAAKSQLDALLIRQEALSKGISVSAAASAFNKNAYGAATGGYIKGPGTGTSDSIPARLSNGEYVIKADAVNAYGRQFMDAVNSKRFAKGGPVNWPYPVSAKGTRIPPLSEVVGKVGGNYGPWPSSPGAQRGDSGVWRKILASVKASGIPYKFGNAYRPGDPKWHGSGRAIDFMGYGQDRLAKFFLRSQNKILEMIHRTGQRDYAYTRGRNKGSFNQSLMNAHKNHLHIAMDGVSQVEPGPFLGYNATGKRETLVNADLLNGPPIYITINNNGVGNMTTQDAKRVRDAMVKLARGNGGVVGLPA